MSEMQPFFEEVQSHYDLSDDFFALFLDSTRTYSCALFDEEIGCLNRRRGFYALPAGIA